jgi:hypothetical protein
LRHSSVTITDKFYSDYLLDDLISTVNDSPLIKQALPVEHLINKGIAAFKSAIGADERVNVSINNDNKGNVILTTYIQK